MVPLIHGPIRPLNKSCSSSGFLEKPQLPWVFVDYTGFVLLESLFFMEFVVVVCFLSLFLIEIEAYFALVTG